MGLYNQYHQHPRLYSFLQQSHWDCLSSSDTKYVPMLKYKWSPQSSWVKFNKENTCHHREFNSQQITFLLIQNKNLLIKKKNHCKEQLLLQGSYLATKVHLRTTKMSTTSQQVRNVESCTLPYLPNLTHSINILRCCICTFMHKKLT